MRDSLESHSLDHLGDQVHKVSKDSKGLLVPREYSTAIKNVIVVLLVLQACRGSVDFLEKQDRKVCLVLYIRKQNLYIHTYFF